MVIFDDGVGAVLEGGLTNDRSNEFDSRWSLDSVSSYRQRVGGGGR